MIARFIASCECFTKWPRLRPATWVVLCLEGRRKWGLAALFPPLSRAILSGHRAKSRCGKFKLDTGQLPIHIYKR